jgi:hypothetical protein
MPGKRITNQAIQTTNYPDAFANNAKLLVDWDALTLAQAIPIKSLGNAIIQGSYNGIDWDNYIKNNHIYVRVSTNGGVDGSWLFLLGGINNVHAPVTIQGSSGTYLSITAGQVLSITLPTEVIGEVPTGDVDDSNTEFTLAHTPVTNSCRVYINGIRQKIETNYTITGAIITFTIAPFTGDVILVDYKYS